MSRRHFPALLAAAMALAQIDPALGATVAGERLPSSMSLPGAQKLALAGCASREMLWKNPYALGLYLPDGTPLSDIRQQSTPKAATVKVAYEGEVPNGPPDRWVEQLRQSAPRDAVQTFLDRYREIGTGDMITIAYTPDAGTAVRRNGETIVEQPGHQLANALLGRWIGQDLVSAEMRSSLLQGEC